LLHGLLLPVSCLTYCPLLQPLVRRERAHGVTTAGLIAGRRLLSPSPRGEKVVGPPSWSVVIVTILLLAFIPKLVFLTLSVLLASGRRF